MNIGIIGAGSVGKALASAWLKAGHRITIGVRDPQSDRYGGLRAAGLAISGVAAASAQDVVVLATPWAQTITLVQSLNLNGKTVIDATNPVAFNAGGVTMMATQSPSAAEDIAAASPNAFVFKTLNQVGAHVMGAAQNAGARPLMFVAGDDLARKQSVVALVEDLGFDARDAGGLNSARHLESLALLWIGQAVRGPMGRNFAIAAVPWLEK